MENKCPSTILINHYLSFRRAMIDTHLALNYQLADNIIVTGAIKYDHITINEHYNKTYDALT
jgi:hypothetical protein